MSKLITHEGKEYILKEEVDNIVTSRISKISESRRTSQSELEAMKEQYQSMQEKFKGVDALHGQIATLQEELSHSNKKYSRHSAIASQGITNPEVRDLIEYQYSKAMENQNKKDRVTMGEWLDGMKGEDAKIPFILQPYLGAKTAPKQEASTQAQLSSLQQSRRIPQPPSSNAHVQPTNDPSTSRDMMAKGGQDFDYYQKNRAKIKEIYYARKGKRI